MALLVKMVYFYIFYITEQEPACLIAACPAPFVWLSNFPTLLASQHASLQAYSPSSFVAEREGAITLVLKGNRVSKCNLVLKGSKQPIARCIPLDHQST